MPPPSSKLSKNVKIIRIDPINSLPKWLSTTLKMFLHFLLLRKFFPRKIRIQIEALQVLLNLRLSYRFIKNNLKSIKIDKYVLFGDRHYVSGIEPALIKYAKEKNLPIIIPPHGHYSDIPSLFPLRRDKDHMFENFSEKAKRLSYPQKDPQSNKLISFFKASKIIALHQFGLTYSNPWVIGASFSNILMVDSEFEASRLIDEGCPKEKVVVTGQIVYDFLYDLRLKRDEIKQRLAKKYCLNEKKPLILVALPQILEQGLGNEEVHWQEINFILRNLEPFKTNCLLALHPKMDRLTYQKFISSFSLNILDDDLKDALPAADVYISTFSSTIQWSGFCAIPTLILDFYGLNYTTYDDRPGIHILRDRKLVHRTIEYMTENALRLSRNMEPYKIMYAPTDGQCRSRIIEYLKKSG